VDQTDHHILRLLDEDARRPVALIAEKLKLARGTVHSRISRLLSPDVLRPHSSRIRPEALGYPMRAFITVTVDQSRLSETMTSLAKIREVVECVAISGSGDVLCQVVARNTEHLYEIGQAISTAPGIQRTATSIVLREHLAFRIVQLLT
jgi:DNA-binding Lrp family transcriptional regulator